MRIKDINYFIIDVKKLTDAGYVDLITNLTVDVLCKVIGGQVSGVQVIINQGIEMMILNGSCIKCFSVKESQLETIVELLDGKISLSTESFEYLKAKYSNLSVIDSDIAIGIKTCILKEIKDIESSYRGQDEMINSIEDKIIVRYQLMNVFSTSGKNMLECRKYYFLNEQKIDNNQIISNNFMCRFKEDIISHRLNRKVYTNMNRQFNKIVSIQDGCYDLILPAGSGSLFFHECLGHVLEIQSASRKESIVYNKIGELLTNSHLTLIDDPTIEDLWGSYEMDDAGVPSKRTILIEDGILKSYLVDKYYGIENNISFTSSARRESYSFNSIARMSNTFIENGKCEPKVIYESLINGIIINEMSIGHVNPITGEFYIGVNKAEVIHDNIKVGNAYNLELRTTTLDVLKNIELIGNDLMFTNGFCCAESGKIPVSGGQPTIKIKQVSFIQK